MMCSNDGNGGGKNIKFFNRTKLNATDFRRTI
jgi:hypothetical protein